MKIKNDTDRSVEYRVVPMTADVDDLVRRLRNLAILAEDLRLQPVADGICALADLTVDLTGATGAN